MTTIIVNLKKQSNHSHQILIGSGLISNLPTEVKKLGSYSNIAVIVDSNSNRLFGKKIKSIFAQSGYKADIFSFPAGEKSKSQKTKTKLEEAMLKAGCDRKTLVVALGGGVVGDLAGFVAATFMRGVDYIQIPTTILAMVDSSVGGKTGINTPQGKNLIGAFWQPNLVFMDLDFLSGLPRNHLVNGLMEAFKMFLTHDAKSFGYCEKNLAKILSGDKGVLEKIIVSALKIKTETIAKDERENGPRMFLNFGHTIGHALEKASVYKLLHGEAVALGILAESKVSNLLGILSEKDYNRIVGFFGRLGFDARQLRRFPSSRIITLTSGDKKARSGKPRYVLLEKIGKVFTKNESLAHEVDKAIVLKSLI